MQDGIFRGTGIRVPMRIVPDGPSYDPKSVQPALPNTNPWGSAEGAGPAEAASMAKVLMTKGDYAVTRRDLGRLDGIAARRVRGG